jgi:hypothetical protein
MSWSLAQLARGDAGAARAAMEEALSTVPHEPVILQRLRLELTSLELDLHDGAWERARERLAQVRREWRRNAVMGSNMDRALFRINAVRIELAAPPACRLRRFHALFGWRMRFVASASPPILRGFARRVAAAAHWQAGRHRAALRELEKSVRLCESQNNAFGIGLAAAARASIRASRGLPGADLDRHMARAHLAHLGATECYLLRNEGWDLPVASDAVEAGRREGASEKVELA